MKRRNHAEFIVQGAAIAALYVVLTLFSNIFGLASGVVQVRISEALTVLPFFTPAAIPGLFVGCIISNLLAGSAVWDVVFGSIATLIGAVGTYLLRKKTKWLAPLPPIAANTVIVPFILAFAYGAEESIPFLMLTVGAGEFISCGVLGLILLKALEKYAKDIFGQ